MDFYALLGLSRAATLVEIKRAYRRLARRFHPDINPGDDEAEARFRAIAQAYEILSDAERRQRYDATGFAEAEDGSSESFGFEGFDFTASVSRDHVGTFGDLFAEMFTNAPAPDPAERGADLHVPVVAAFDEALEGFERTVTMTRRATCGRCAGSGTLHAAETTCVRCQGTGTLRTARGHMVFSKPCLRCGGRGRLTRRICDQCGGDGLETRAETLTVRFLPGATDGTQIRLSGRGNAGRHGGPPGDLLVTVTVEADTLFRRLGDDLHVVVPVAIHEAALGARIDVPTLTGPARLRLPAGAQSGQRFRLRQRGAPSPHTGQRGDLVVEIRLVMPRDLDERSKELLRKFGELNAENVRRDMLETATRARRRPQARP